MKRNYEYRETIYDVILRVILLRAPFVCYRQAGMRETGRVAFVCFDLRSPLHRRSVLGYHATFTAVEEITARCSRDFLRRWCRARLCVRVESIESNDYCVNYVAINHVL